MGNVIVNDEYLKSAADAIRARGKTTAGIKLPDMADAIAAIPSRERMTRVGYQKIVLNLARDTAFDTTTPTGTAQTILATQTNAFDIWLDEVVDTEQFELVTISSRFMNYRYKKGDVIPRLLFQKSVNTTRFFKAFAFPLTTPDDLWDASKYRIFSSAVSYTISPQQQITTAGAVSLQSTMQYGVVATAATPTAWTINSPSGISPINTYNYRYCSRFTWNPAAITIRTSAAIMTNAAFADMDSAATEIVEELIVYKVPKADTSVFDRVVGLTYRFAPLTDENIM